jgi:hypothetical protein
LLGQSADVKEARRREYGGVEPPPNQDGEVDDEDSEENVLDEKQSAGSEAKLSLPVPGDPSKMAEKGVLSRIELVNFMCHRKLFSSVFSVVLWCC